MHKEEIGNKIYLIWLFSPISQINISNRDDIWQDKKCLLGKLNLVFPSKSQIYLQFEMTDEDSAAGILEVLLQLEDGCMMSFAN